MPNRKKRESTQKTETKTRVASESSTRTASRSSGNSSSSSEIKKSNPPPQNRPVHKKSIHRGVSDHSRQDSRKSERPHTRDETRNKPRPSRNRGSRRKSANARQNSGGRDIKVVDHYPDPRDLSLHGTPTQFVQSVSSSSPHVVHPYIGRTDVYTNPLSSMYYVNGVNKEIGQNSYVSGLFRYAQGSSYCPEYTPFSTGVAYPPVIYPPQCPVNYSTHNSSNYARLSDERKREDYPDYSNARVYNDRVFD